MSILIAAGGWACLGWQPRAKVSMMIMRPPQHGHGRGRMRGWSARWSRVMLRCSAPPARRAAREHARCWRRGCRGEQPVMTDAMEALGSTWIRKRRMNSCVGSVMVL